MPFVVGGFAAMVALAAGILAQVDPLTSLWRATLAFVMGWIGGSLWHAVTAMGRPDANGADTPASTGKAETSYSEQ